MQGCKEQNVQCVEDGKIKLVNTGVCQQVQYKSLFLYKKPSLIATEWYVTSRMRACELNGGV